MLSETTCPDTIGKSQFAGKTSIFIAAIFISFMVAGCSTTTYLSLTENSREQVEEQLKYAKQDKYLGAEVTLLLKDGIAVFGELLSVRDSTMAICSKYAATEKELASLKYPINTVRNNKIKKLTIEGSNYVWTGIGYGALGGALIGTLGPLLESKGYTVFKILVLAPLGLLVGGGIGAAVGYGSSTEEFILQEIPPDYDLSILKPLARYSDEEPEYLRAIK